MSLPACDVINTINPNNEYSTKLISLDSPRRMCTINCEVLWNHRLFYIRDVIASIAVYYSSNDKKYLTLNHLRSDH